MLTIHPTHALALAHREHQARVRRAHTRRLIRALRRARRGRRPAELPTLRPALTGRILGSRGAAIEPALHPAPAGGVAIEPRTEAFEPAARAAVACDRRVRPASCRVHLPRRSDAAPISRG